MTITMTTTERMEQAQWDLRELTISDPAATSNMMRHAAATAIMLSGRRPRDKAPGEPEISGCFIPSASDRAFLTRVTKQTGIDQVFTTFDVDVDVDVDDAAGPPIGLMLTRNEGDAVVTYDAECTGGR